jgi:O-antigen/teichoic acid export membrane protein
MPKWAKDNEELLKVINNIVWLFLDKFLRLGLGLFVAIWLARYLEPENYGLLNFSMAFVGMFGIISSLGLSEIIVRDLVNKPQESLKTLGTSFFLELIGGILAYLLAIVIIFYLRPNDTIAKSIVVILGLTLILKSTNVIRNWFESQVQSKFVVLIDNGVFFFIAGIKVIMILVHAPLIAFVIAYSVEVFLISFILLIVYNKKEKNIRLWEPTIKRSKELLSDSWPLILSGIAISVFMKIDQIMLGEMLGDKSVGIYSAAVKISELWYFIPSIIVSSFFPSIIKLKSKSEELYYSKLQMLFDLLIWVSIIISIFMTFFSDFIVNLFFGLNYSESASVLKIHVWTGIAVSYGIVWSKWILIENKLKMIILFHVLAMIINIIYNLYFIRSQGAVGAAIATALGSLTAQTIGILFYKRKIALRFLLKSLIPVHWINK